jgi:hypothetical protein
MISNPIRNRIIRITELALKSNCCGLEPAAPVVNNRHLVRKLIRFKAPGHLDSTHSDLLPMVA